MDDQLKELGEIARFGAEAVGKHFNKPDDDWLMTVFLADEEGRTTVAGVDPNFFASETAKNILGFNALPKLVADTNAVLVALLTSTWSVRMEDEEKYAEYLKWREQNPDASLGEYPGHYESLQLFLTDGEETEYWSAEIIRSEDRPPLLSEWENQEVDGASGRMFGPLVAALKEGKGIIDSGEEDACVS